MGRYINSSRYVDATVAILLEAGPNQFTYFMKQLRGKGISAENIPAIALKGTTASYASNQASPAVTTPEAMQKKRKIAWIYLSFHRKQYKSCPANY